KCTLSFIAARSSSTGNSAVTAGRVTSSALCVLPICRAWLSLFQVLLSHRHSGDGPALTADCWLSFPECRVGCANCRVFRPFSCRAAVYWSKGYLPLIANTLHKKMAELSSSGEKKLLIALLAISLLARVGVAFYK